MRPNRSPILIAVKISCLISLVLFFITSCIKPADIEEGPTNNVSTVETEDIESEVSLDWSTVNPEDLWQGVFGVYESDGPRYALSLLDKAIENEVVTYVEADQVRAGFLYELGRLDEAFIRLSSYIIDTDRPDLLQLRAVVLWGMGRYDEALRDYLAVYESDPENAPPEILVALARIYYDLGEWDKAEEFRGYLELRDDAEAMILQLDLYDVIMSENPILLSEFLNDTLSDVTDSESDPAAKLVQVYAEYLEGEKTSAMSNAQGYISDVGFDSNIGLILLRLNVETGEFESFIENLRTMLNQLEAIQWFDALPDTYPQPVDQPMAVGSLIDSASAIELGSGNRARARILADRALMLNPYDYIAYLQLAAVDIADHDISSAFGNLNQALILATPSDIRTRVRILQFSSLAAEGVELPWNTNEIAADLDELLNYYEQKFPLNSFYKAARAELIGFRSDLEGAVSKYTEALSLPGATRETAYRLGYWLAREGRVDEAIEIVRLSIPSESPYLMWVTAVELEAEVRADSNLMEFAAQIHAHLDPMERHGEFFE